MNNNRRKELRKAEKLVDQAQDILQTCMDDEQDYFDNMPESIRFSEKGHRVEEVCSELDEHIDQLSDTSQYLGQLIA